jgi:hypothetical protein
MSHDLHVGPSTENRSAAEGADGDASVRLSVNLGAEPAAGFRAVIKRKGLSISEGIRRAIETWIFIQHIFAAGGTIYIQQSPGAEPERLMPFQT